MYVWLKLSTVYYHCDTLLCLFAAATFYAPNTIHNLEQFNLSATNLCDLQCFYYFFLLSFFSLGSACNSSASLGAFDIADGFVRQLPKMSSFQCYPFRIVKNGLGEI
jgi:hypothetical protein